MDTKHLLEILELEGRALDQLVRDHPLLRPLFTRDFRDKDVLRSSYLQLLKISADYVQYTVPALRVAGRVLSQGDAGDRHWGRLLLSYALGETAADDEQGHHFWARQDMVALGAPANFVQAPPHVSAVLYGKYFVDDAARHPYAILGAKAVLEHAAVRGAGELARGVAESGISLGKEATRFFHHHGELDVDHSREGSHDLKDLEHEGCWRQIIEGAYVTTGTYRALVATISC